MNVKDQIYKKVAILEWMNDSTTGHPDDETFMGFITMVFNKHDGTYTTGCFQTVREAKNHIDQILEKNEAKLVDVRGMYKQ